jgi:hypothetical protein
VLAAQGAPALPSCATVEILSLIVQDPDGKAFATLGLGSRP